MFPGLDDICRQLEKNWNKLKLHIDVKRFYSTICMVFIYVFTCINMMQEEKHASHKHSTANMVINISEANGHYLIQGSGQVGPGQYSTVNTVTNIRISCRPSHAWLMIAMKIILLCTLNNRSNLLKLKKKIKTK